MDAGLPGALKCSCSLDERIEILERNRWLKQFSGPQFQTLAQYLECYRLPQNLVLFQEGSHDASLCVIAEGEINILKEGPQGNKVVATLGPGKMVGEMSLLDGEPRSATAVAVTPVCLLLLHKQAFEKIEYEAPRLMISLVKMLGALVCERLRQTTGSLVDHLDH